MPNALLQAISLPDTDTWLSVTYTYDDDQGEPVTHMLNVIGENAERGPFILKRFTEFLKDDLGFTIQENVTVSVSPTIFPPTVETKGRFTETTIKAEPASMAIPPARKRRPLGRYLLAAAASLVVAVGATWEFMGPSIATALYRFVDDQSPIVREDREYARVIHMDGKWYAVLIEKREGDPWVIGRFKHKRQITSDSVGFNVLLAEKTNAR